MESLKNNIQITLNLAKNDFKQKYAASSLGIVWGFIPSVATILIYWFVFTMAFRSATGEEPYLIWLMSGMIPWLYFQEAVVGITNSFTDYSYLVKKVVFNIELLPYVRAISAVVIHAFFLFLMMMVLLGYGFLPKLTYLQIIYYLFCMVCFAIAFGRISATLNVLFRDISNLIMIILQFGVWMLPILWQPAQLSETVLTILKLNPIFYVIVGYRDSLLYGVWFTEYMTYTAYFWLVTIVLDVLGRRLLSKLKGQFSDLM